MRPFLLIALFSWISQLSAQNSVEDFLSYSFHSELVSSPDGKIGWVVNKKGVRNVFYAEAPDYRPVQLTDYSKDDGQGISQLVFNANSIIYVRGGAPNRSGEYPNPTSDPNGANREILQLDIISKVVTKIADGHSPKIYKDAILYLKAGQCMIYQDSTTKQLFKMRGSINSLRLSPDQSHLAFRSSRGDHSFIALYTFADSSIRVLSPSVDFDSNPVWSPDGKKVAFLRIPHQESVIFTPQREALPFGLVVYDLEEDKVLTTWTVDKGKGSAYRSISAANQLFWMSDGTIIFPWEKEGWTHLYTFDYKTNKTKSLLTGEHEIQFVNQSADWERLIFSSNKNDIDRQHLWEYTNGGEVRQLTSGEGVEWFGVDVNGLTFYLGSNGTTPASLFQLEGSSTNLISGSIGYINDALVEPEQTFITAADGMTINAQLFLPKDLKKNDKRPALIFFHGGSRRQMLLGFHHRGYYHYAYAMNQYLASQGYVVLSVNYRSGIGYGMEFREAVNYGAQGASEFNDVMGAGLFLKSHPNVDGSKIGLWGGSYGGYLTALGLSRASDLFAAGVDIHGVTDWNVIIKNFVPSYNPLENPEFAKLAYDSSPIAFMDTWKSPVLLIHGDDDRNVPFSETVDKVELLRKNDVYFEQLIFPDEVHGFLLHRNWVDAYKASADFFDRMLEP